LATRRLTEETLLTFTATATDADVPAQSLTFSLDAGAPTGAGMTSGGVFTWTPTEAQGAEHERRDGPGERRVTSAFETSKSW